MASAWQLMEALDKRGGASRIVARNIIATARTVKNTRANRHLSLVRWSPSRDAWIHRWPSGRVVDAARWSTPEKWATGGGHYDMSDLLWSNYKPRAGDTVFDVGAGHGGETFFLASLVGERGTVVSIEAAPAPFEKLRDMVRLNGWKHVEPVQVALSDRAGTLSITDDESNWVEGNIYSEGGVSVPAATFDDLCAERGITTVDWVKMNIEGAEKEAVRGMERMAPHVRHMTISCHDFLGTEWGRSKDQVLLWLHDHGFQTRVRGSELTWDANYVYAWRE